MKDHKELYGIYLRSSMFVSLTLIILAFLFVPTIEVEPYELKRDVVTLVEEISSQIDKFEEPPPRERPKIAIEAPDEISEEVVETIAETIFRENIIKTTPTGPDIEIVPYYKVEVKPQPIAIPKPVYPSLAQQAGIEGQAVVKALVDTDGTIREVQILKSRLQKMISIHQLSSIVRLLRN